MSLLTVIYRHGLPCLRWPQATCCLLIAGAMLTVAVQADPIVVLPRHVPGAKERPPSAAVDEMPIDLKAQKGLAWKKAEVRNLKMGDGFLAENRKRPGVKTLKSGLQYKVVKIGEGATPKKSDTVAIFYKGTLLDGTVFANKSSVGGEPERIKLSRAIPAWKEALKRMPVGSRWQLFVPPQLGYGNEGAPPAIGPGATLIYDLELVAIEAAEAKAGTP